MNENNAKKYIRSAEAIPQRHTPEHTKKLLAALGKSFEKIKFLKIYGESGKSLLASRLSYLLTASGFRTGILSLSHPENASRESILIDGAIISASLFADATSTVATTLLQEGLSSEAPVSEEILLASGLLALSRENCRFIILECTSATNSAASAISAPILNVITHVCAVSVAKSICKLLDKTGEETVTCMQSPDIMKYITDRCAEVNCRITFPIVSNSLYIMEHTLGKIRFFYNKKEYLLSCGSKYELYAALSLIECHHALIRRGVRLTQTALSVALSATPNKRYFHVFSMFPYILLDAANTPDRLEALAETLVFQKGILNTAFDVWATKNSAETIKEAFQKHDVLSLRTLTLLDEDNIYRSTKNALREYDKSLPLLILGNGDLICQIEKTLQNLI